MSPSGTSGVLGVACLLLMEALLIAGCSSFSDEAPPVPDSTLTAVLVDVHLARARTRVDTVVPASLPDSVLARHGVPRSDLDATLRYYSHRPKAFATLYNAVIDTLNALQRRRYDRRPRAGRPDTLDVQ